MLIAIDSGGYSSNIRFSEKGRYRNYGLEDFGSYRLRFVIAFHGVNSLIC